MSKKAKILALFLFFLILFSVLAYNYYWTSSIVVTIENDYDVTKTTVLIDGSSASLKLSAESKEYSYELKVKPGTHTIDVDVYGYEPMKSKTETSPREIKNVSLNLQKKAIQDPESIARSLIGDGNATNISNSRLFDEDTWLVFTTYNAGSDGSIVIAKLNPTTESWEILDAGTDIDLGNSIFLEAPKSLREYLSSL